MSHYFQLDGIPFMLNPKFFPTGNGQQTSVETEELTKRTFPPPNDLFNYDCSLEKMVIAQLEKSKQERLKIEEEKAKQQEEKMKKVAPGLSSQALEPSIATPKPARDDNKLTSQQQRMTNSDYLEFEQGLPPPNPWDQPQSITEEIQTLATNLSNQNLSAAPHTKPKQTQGSVTAVKTPVPGGVAVLPSVPPILPSRTNSPRSLSAMDTLTPTQRGIMQRAIDKGHDKQIIQFALKRYPTEKLVLDCCYQYTVLMTQYGCKAKDIEEAYTVMPAQSNSIETLRSYCETKKRVLEFGFAEDLVKTSLIETKDGAPAGWVDRCVSHILAKQN
jgi:hypothetical protein